MWHAHDGMGWWMVFGGGLWVLFLVLVAVFLLTMFRPTSPRRQDDPSGPGALEIARQRYARGEISREEFEQLRQDLRDPD